MRFPLLGGGASQRERTELPESGLRCSSDTRQEDAMGRGLLLWLIGIPLPIILIIWLLDGLHG
jgi:hypothetical protein